MYGSSMIELGLLYLALQTRSLDRRSNAQKTQRRGIGIPEVNPLL